MKLTIDREADALYLTLKDAPVDHTQEIDEEVYADYDVQGDIIGLEILNWSQWQTRGEEALPSLKSRRKRDPEEILIEA